MVAVRVTCAQGQRQVGGRAGRQAGRQAESRQAESRQAGRQAGRHGGRLVVAGVGAGRGRRKKGQAGRQAIAGARKDVMSCHVMHVSCM